MLGEALRRMKGRKLEHGAPKTSAMECLASEGNGVDSPTFVDPRSAYTELIDMLAASSKRSRSEGIGWETLRDGKEGVPIS
jgi:hypothetical protein